MNPDVIEPSYTTRDRVRLLKVDAETIRSAVARGELLSIRVGVQRRYPESAVRAWLELGASGD